jgi:biopolymer transport protein ExbD
MRMDMTPMIDCVFQLIIFFFLIIDLQNQDLEILKLPKSDFQVPDEPEGNRPIINVLQDGEIKYKGQRVYDPDINNGNEWGQMKGLLRDMASRMKKDFDPNLKMELPDDPLLIRADMWTEMHHVAKVMEHCGHKDILIWKVELAVGERKDGRTAADFLKGKGGSK